SCVWLAKSFSCMAQNLSLPCSYAAIAASAAGIALGWNDSGWFFQAIRTLPLYSSSICLSVGSTRPQNGHWKSDHSTMVTGAFFGPRTGAAPTSTVNFWSAAGAAAAWGALPADLTLSATIVS